MFIILKMSSSTNALMCPEGNTIASGRFRAWSFTSYTTVPDFDEKIMKYLICGLEKCPTTDNVHWQSYIYFIEKKSFMQVKNLLPKGCHFEPSKGNPKSNYDYCSKDGKFVEFGELPQKGKRTDLIELKNDLINNNITVEEIILENPIMYHQYGRTLEKIEEIKLRKQFRTEMTEGIWYYGNTGVGKSHEAFKDYNPDTHYLLNIQDNGWWEGYNGQETVIINDFRGEIPYNTLLQIIDKWPYDIKKRNRGSLPFISKKVIITSSLSPEEVYRNRNEKDCIKQLLRRLKVIKLN